MILLENDCIRTELLPGIGGKMVTLKSKKTEINYLFDPGSDYTIPTYGDTFDLRYAYGFDECFPTVEPCNYSLGGKNIQLPDHGEVWNRPWNYQQFSDSVELYIEGNEMDYVLKKKIRLADCCVQILYELVNMSEIEFEYLWSAHPLLNIQPGDQVILEHSVKKLSVYWSTFKSLEAGEYVEWPSIETPNQPINLSEAEEFSTDFAIKLFSDKLEKGDLALYKPDYNESLRFHFDPASVPYAGLWFCYGGWPTDVIGGVENIALEPSTSNSDSLLKAVKANTAQKIAPKSTNRWRMDLSITEGKPNM